MASIQSEMQEPSIDTDKLSYEIFSILESKFLFGYDDQKLWMPKQISPVIETKCETTAPATVDTGVAAIKNQRGKICILSIDGGGMQGIISGKALAYLEQALKTKSGNPDARIADYFDVAAGTGVGGIFTAMLFATKGGTRPIFRAEDTWKFLAEQGKRFFRSSSGSGSGGGRLRRLFKGGTRGSTGSSTAGLERAMKEAFTEKGRNLTLKDTLKPVLITCYDLSSSAPFLFSRADALETDSYDFRLWEVCRATSSEPALFEPVAMRSVDGQTRCVAIDGGLGMCNPAAAAITHVLHNKQEFPFVRGIEDVLVLSLGSGQLLEGCYDYDQVKGWKAKEWAKPMARIAGDGAADFVDHAVAMAFGQSRSSNYVRIQSEILGTCQRLGSAVCIYLGLMAVMHFVSMRTSICLKSYAANRSNAGPGRFPLVLNDEFHEVFVFVAEEWISVCPKFTQCSSGASRKGWRKYWVWNGLLRMGDGLGDWMRNADQANGSNLGRCGASVDSDPSPSNVKMLVGVAEEMLKQKNVESVLFGGKRIGEQTNFEKLDWFAGELVLEHQRRSCRIAPTVAFKQAAPKPN
ncbi:hypothetical protein HHK36_016598 [Tetracentron sinense]|uniref:Patatin n=1 Tax=Tetracentron sinense TaxID=13715 RepID=A0A834Z0P9_TETSI|nr:hypothetical protein HHK36_016598 [Tetracentron sinense]